MAFARQPLPSATERAKGGHVVLIIGLGLTILGWIGVFSARRVIKAGCRGSASTWRTPRPCSSRGKPTASPTLKKIGGYEQGSLHNRPPIRKKSVTCCSVPVHSLSRHVRDASAAGRTHPGARAGISRLPTFPVDRSLKRATLLRTRPAPRRWPAAQQQLAGGAAATRLVSTITESVGEAGHRTCRDCALPCAVPYSPHPVRCRAFA